MVSSPAAGLGFALELPSNAVLNAELREEFTSHRLPVAVWKSGEVPHIRTEGPVFRRAWQVRDDARSTLQLLAPLRDQLLEADFDILFECEARECGGFDFRFGIDILPEPDMHVDLGDYRFLSARRMGPDRPEYVSLIISRSADEGFVQITRVNISDPPPPVRSTKSAPSAVPTFGLLAERLNAKGAAVLDDLVFDAGSASLKEGHVYPSLAELAQYLKVNTETAILLVGHTDAKGGLEANIRLSRQRALSVATRLSADYGVPPSRLQAEGIGFMAPRADNLTKEGRAKNRRVEVVLASTQ
ncbi:MAG: OmpA family protein [Pseudomonadota bacterium]